MLCSERKSNGSEADRPLCAHCRRWTTTPQRLNADVRSQDAKCCSFAASARNIDAERGQMHAGEVPPVRVEKSLDSRRCCSPGNRFRLCASNSYCCGTIGPGAMWKWIKSLFSGLLGTRDRKSPAPLPPRQHTPTPRWTRPVLSIDRHTGMNQPPPLKWKECHPRTRAKFKAELTCSRGHAISLRSHTIAPDGMVHPSVVCLEPGCDFHDHVRLKQWEGGSL
jgi:hypothetical protein